MGADQVRIVVVDDNADSAESLAELMRLNGYAVWTAHSAQSALTLIEQEGPHCVLFDIVMPGMSGDELCRRLRELYGDDIVLIAVSGCSNTDPRVDESFTMADHYFTKPIDPVALEKLFRHVR